MKPPAPCLSLSIALLATPALAELAPVVEAPCTDVTKAPCRPAPAPAPPPPLPAPAGAPGEEGLVTHSPALAIGGGVLSALGAMSLSGGLAVYLVVRGSGYVNTREILGLPLLIHGAGCIAAGIPMIRIGSRMIPRPPPKTPSAEPQVSIGPGSLSLRWTF